MPICLPNCTIFAPRRDNCKTYIRPGGVNRLIFIACSVKLEHMDDPEELKKELCFYAKQGLLTISSPIFGSKPKANFIKRQIDSCMPEEVTGVQRQIDFQDYLADSENFSDYTYWEQISENYRLFQMGFVTCEGLLYGFLDRWTIEVDQVIEQNQAEGSYWDGTISWYGKTPTPIFIPDLVSELERCSAEFNLEELDEPIEEGQYIFGIGSIDTTYDFSSPEPFGRALITAYGSQTGRYEYELMGLDIPFGPVTTIDSNVFSSLPYGRYRITVREYTDMVGYVPRVDSAEFLIENPCLSLRLFASIEQRPMINESNGVIKATVTGGFGPFRYRATDSTTVIGFQDGNIFNNLAAGVWNITAMDTVTGCTANFEVRLFNRDCTVLTYRIEKRDWTENEPGWIKIIIDSGSGSYRTRINSGNWSSSLFYNNLPAGMYEISVEDLGLSCTIEKEVEIVDLCSTFEILGVSAVPSGGENNGQITVTVGGSNPSGNFSYSIDGGGTWTGSPYISNLAPGFYFVHVKDNTTGCVKRSNEVVITNLCDSFSVSLAGVVGSGNSVGTGSITVSPSNPAYIYSIDNVNWQNNGFFNDVYPGVYTVRVRDLQNDCTAVIAEVEVPNLCLNMSLDIGLVVPTGENDSGRIEIVNVNGVTPGPYEYSLDNANWFPIPSLPFQIQNLAYGTYNVHVRCTTTFCRTTASNIVVGNLCQNLAISNVGTSPSGTNADGVISINSVVGGTPPYEYSVNGVSWQSFNTFNSISAGIYTVYVRDANMCVASKGNVTVGDRCSGFAITGYQAVGAGGDNNGRVTITSVSGDYENLQYAKSDFIFSSSPTLTGFSAGQHTVYVRCTVTNCVTSATVTVPDICSNLKFGPIQVTGSGVIPTGIVNLLYMINGSGTYTQSTDGINFTPFGVPITNVPQGDLTIFVRDENTLCIKSTVVNVPSICKDQIIQSVSVTGSGVNPTGSALINGIIGGPGTWPDSYEIGINPASLASTTTGSITGIGIGEHTIYARNTITGCISEYAIKIPNICSSLRITAINTLGDGDEGVLGTNIGRIEVVGYQGNEGSVTFRIEGPVDIGFNASPVFDSLPEGEYNVYIMDSVTGCVASRKAVVGSVCQNLRFSGSASVTGSGVEDIGEVGSPTVIGGSGNYEYRLFNTAMIYDETNNTGVFENVPIGSASLIVSDLETGCRIETTIQVPDICESFSIGEIVSTAAWQSQSGIIELLNINGGVDDYETGIPNPGYNIEISLVDTNSWVSSNTGVFTNNIIPGEYMMRVTDIISGCVATKTFIVKDACETFKISNLTTLPAGSVAGTGTGTITVTVDGAVGPINYYIDDVANPNGINNPTITEVLPGERMIRVEDVTTGCSHSKNVNVPFICSNFAITNVITIPGGPGVAPGLPTGRIYGITTTPISGTIRYSIDGGATWQNDTLFENVAPGTYTMIAENTTHGCIATRTVTVPQANPPVIGMINVLPGGPGDTILSIPPSGEATVVQSYITGGSGDYAYSLDGTNFLTGPEANHFEGLQIGVQYVAYVRDNVTGLIATRPFTVPSICPSLTLPPPLITNPTTPAASDGVVSGTPSYGGVGPYEYRLEGVTDAGPFDSGWGATQTFTGLYRGNYRYFVRDMGTGCIQQLNVSLS